MDNSLLENDQLIKQTILIVDDAIENRMLLKKLLRKKYEILEASSGEAALQIIFSDNLPDLILLDVNMAGMNGYEVCQVLKSNKNTEFIPVIFITGNDDERDEVRGFEVGAVDYIKKPFSPLIVNVRIQTHLELKRNRDILESYSFLDGLTGISNRRRFNEYLETSWQFNARESFPLSIILIDIDHFKKYNDFYGHLAGDECLKKVARELTRSVGRKLDLVARYGGEEFGCILPNTKKEGALKVAERMRTNILSLGIEHVHNEEYKIVTISLGVATTIPESGSSFEILIKKADEALYISKESGRNKTNYSS